MSAPIRMPIRKAMGLLHLWLGLGSGLIVFILSVTGCIYVFENELKPLVYSGRMSARPTPAGTLPLSALWDIAQKELGEAYPIRRVFVENRPDRAWVFGSSKSDPKAWTYFGETVWNYRVFVDPYSGKVNMVEDSKYEFFNLDLWLHWSLLLSNKVGQPIVGSAVLCFVVILLTGLVLWWPRNRTSLKARLKVAWKAPWKKVNWDLHSVFGFYAMCILLLIGLTGLVWAFKWFNNSAYFIATGGRTFQREAPLRSDTLAAGGGRPLDAIFAQMRRTVPEAREYFLFLPEAKSGAVSASARSGGHAHYRSLRMQFDQHTGALLKTRSFTDQDRGEKLRSLNYDLHVGSILGLPGKILAFLASLVSATLPITGLLVWFGKRKGKANLRRKKEPGAESAGSPRKTARGALLVSGARERDRYR